ncbi:right-handed parallel beta-helix repeat-containing protein [Jidongwangia harbinensis]|uniref:right-handed parallel beta-helix repeat-containing protein n=1 Tax=Jidongwangia harbinensis TaxID=2878561 RepID=UPI001CD96C5C|nr:right-handed parallel beta-helix repeat-containing protein [Jidongwangia harbinensis]MCA2211317.1 right-handed parallel beta-helix repeat-containing protein [Jidongwangia harbinensis]
MPLAFRVRRAVVLTALAVALPAASAAVATPATAALPDAPAYTLASTLSPAPLGADACAADPACVVAAAPRGGDLDDYTALLQAVSTAATRTRPAVMAADGSVLTPPVTATVRLAPGVYRLTSSLRLPPNVDLRGAGIAATSLVMDATLNWRNFSYGFLVRASDKKEPGSANLVADLTVNGNCRTGAGAPEPADLPGRPGQPCDLRAALGAHTNTGGGIAVGNRWTVRQVRFTNFEYFKLWVSGTEGVRIVDNRFDNWGGAESDGEDNIGGGGRNDGTVIEHNRFDRTVRGNSFDFTNAIRTTVRNNVVHTDPAVAASRDESEYGNMYFEGVVGAAVTGNVLFGAHIVLTSNAGYAHSGTNKDITNPRDMLVAGNRIVDSATVGVAVGYADYPDADGTGGTPGGWTDASTGPADHVVRPGGNNIVRDNLIERPRQSGIIVYGTAHAKNAPDAVLGNRIVNAGFGGSTTYNTGSGYFDTAGIGLSVGRGDAIHGNAVVDDQEHPTTWYGVQLGARRSAARPSDTSLTGPDGVTNTADGIIATPLRTAALAPEAPGNLTADGAVLTWDEAYPAGNPIAGYRVYRDGVPVADLPVGSAAVPGNLLDPDAADLESAAAGTAGWTAGALTRVSRTDTAGAVGTSSLLLSATGAGQLSASGRKVTAVAGDTYTSVGSFRAGGAGRRVRAGLAFTDAAGKVTRLGSHNSATVDGPAGWTTSSYTAKAPSGTVAVQAFMMVEGAVAGEVHLLDRLGLVAGTATEQWADPSGTAGRFDVVAYGVVNGENSAVTSLTTS